jgi:hypothetical protein
MLLENGAASEAVVRSSDRINKMKSLRWCQRAQRLPPMPQGFSSASSDSVEAFGERWCRDCQGEGLVHFRAKENLLPGRRLQIGSCSDASSNPLLSGGSAKFPRIYAWSGGKEPRGFYMAWLKVDTNTLSPFSVGPLPPSRKNKHRPLHAQIIMKCANVRKSPRLRKSDAEPRKAQGWIRGRLRYTESRLRGCNDEA